MLQSIREGAQSWVAWILVGFLIFIFAIWGIGSYFTPDPNPVVASVNGAEITQRDLRNAVQNQRERLRRAGIDERMVDAALIKQQALEGLINQAVLASTAEDAGMRIGDAQLGVRIHDMDAFKRDGQFSQDRYFQVLSGNGMGPDEFEQGLREDWMVQQVSDGVINSALVTGAELDRLLKLQKQKREVATLTLPASRFEAGVEIDDAAVKEYYDNHPDAFRTPELVTIGYLELSLDKLAEKVMVDEDLVRQRYEENASAYTKEERRKARHILVSVPSDADDQAVEAARKKAEDLKARIDNGESFEELAKVESDDPGSAAKGGDLGFFGRGQMVPAFEEVAYNLEVGQVSEPVRSPFGFHIIEVTEIEPEQIKPFEEVREELTKELKKELAEKQFFEIGENLANLTYEQPDSLEPAAETLGLELKTAGPFTRSGGEGITAEPKVTTAAFSEDVLIAGNNSEPLELDDGRIVVLRVTEHQPASLKPLEQVHEEVVESLRKEKAQKMAKQKGEELVNALKQGGDPVALAEQAGVEWKQDGSIERNHRGLARELVAKAFALDAPKEDAPSFGGVVLADGDYGIVEVVSIQEGEMPAEKELEQQRAALEKMLGRVEFDALRKVLRKNSKVTVNTALAQ